MARVRSPNYPQISLEDAVNRVALIFSKEHQHAAPKEVIVKDMGYNGIHGNSLGALSALSKYGLLERDGQDYKVSDRAIAIIHPESDDGRLAALREAAQAPSLFAEIFEHFKGHLPSDENLKAYLIRKGFAESALTPVIVTLRDTMKFVGDTPLHVTGKGALQAQPAQLAITGHAPVVLNSTPQPEQELPEFVPKMRVSLFDQGLHVEANIVDKKGLDRLILVLRANREILPDGISNDVKVEVYDDKPPPGDTVNPLLR